jgi:hypothetical protein
MHAITLVTDADLARARHDFAFRHRLLAENLEMLLATLNKLRGLDTNATRERQLREGAALAVRLADLLQRIASEHPDAQQAA